MICVMRKSTKNIFFSWFFILGVITLSLGLLNFLAIGFGLLMFVICLVVVIRRWPNDFAGLLPWFFLWFIIGSFCLVWQERPILNNRFSLNQSVKYSGLIQDVRQQPAYQRLTISTKQGLVWVFTKTWPIFWPGDQVSWQCQLQPLDWRSQLQNQVQVSCWDDQLRFLDHHWSIKWFFIKQKDYLNRLLISRVAEPEADLAAGLLWGESALFPKDLTLAFQRAGLSHIVAVSGYNFTIILLVVSQLLIRFGFNKKTSWWLELGFIIAFVFFTGASGSVLRAGLMASLVVSAYASGRKISFLALISWMFVGLAVFNPALLVFDIGFQLSVAATLGLVYAESPLEKILSFALASLSRSGPALIRETLATTLAAILSTSPLILCYFGNFSLIALISNILILPLLAWNMSLALAVLMLGWLPGLGVAIGWLTTISLRGLIEVVLKLAKLPLASLSLAPDLFWLGLYALIIPLICYWQKKYE